MFVSPSRPPARREDGWRAVDNIDGVRPSSTRDDLGVYVHVPFCERVCPYCDFAVVAGGEDLTARYTAAVVKEIEHSPPGSAPVDAIAVGGGTPTRLPAEELSRIVAVVRHHIGLAAEAEVSVEANPEDWSPRLAAALVDAGFNRVSLGAQSFDPAVLEALGRQHRPEDAERAVAAARHAGFRSVNVDLIFGTPGESMASWRTSVRRALGSGIDHLSCYALTVERGTPLSRAVGAGAAAPDPDVQADMYEAAWELAASAGLDRYETSNAARPGHACGYNLITWAGGSYHGFGNGAHRHRDGERSWNVRRVERYLEQIEASGHAVQGRERLDPRHREQERLVLGLRRAAGVVGGEAGAELLGSEWGTRLLAAGVIAVDGDRIRVVRPLLGDEVARAVLALAPPTGPVGSSGDGVDPR